jgi:hypothetical protein
LDTIPPPPNRHPTPNTHTHERPSPWSHLHLLALLLQLSLTLSELLEHIIELRGRRIGPVLQQEAAASRVSKSMLIVQYGSR